MKHLLALTLICACSSKAPPPVEKPVAPASAARAVVVRGDIVSPGFKAGELKNAMPVGHEIRYKVTGNGATQIQRWRIIAADDTSGTIHTVIFAEDGTTQIEDKGTETSAWAELEKHGEFPVALTTYREATVDVIAGKFDTWLFEVQPAKPGEPVRRMHFDRKLPGPPIWMEMTIGDEVVLKIELVSRK